MLLSVDVEGRFAQFLDGLDKIERQTKRSADSMSRAFSVVNSALAGIGVTLGVGAVVAYFTDAIGGATKWRAALDDLSDTTGDSVKTLDGLARQAKVAGVEFDQLGGGLSKLAKNLNSADDEGKAAGKALEAIGLNIANIQALKPAEAMNEIAKALGGFEDGAGKVAVAMALFGREGAKLLPLFKDIAEDGATAGRITAEQAAQAEKLEKEWRRLKQTFVDAKDGLADQMIPALQKLVSNLKEATQITGSFWSGLLLFGKSNPFGSLGENVATLRAEFEKLQKAADTFSARGDRGLAAGLQGQLTSAKQKLDLFKFMERQQALEKTGPQFLDARDLKALQKPVLKPDLGGGGAKGSAADPFGDMRTRLQKELSTIGDAGHKASAELESAFKFDKNLSTISGLQKDILRDLAAEVDFRRQAEKAVKAQLAAEEDLKASGAEYLKFVTDMDIKNRDAAQAIREQLDPTEKLRDEIFKISQLMKERDGQPAFLSLETGEAALEKLNVDFLKAQAAANTFGEEVKKVDNFARDMGLSFSSAFEDAIVGGKKFGDILKSLGQDIARIITRKTITEPLGNALTSSLGGSGGIGDFFKNLFSGGSSWMSSAAGGMDFVSRDGPVFLHRGEKVLTAAENARGGGVSIVQNMTFGSDVNRGTLLAWGQQIKQQTVAAVFDLQKRV